MRHLVVNAAAGSVVLLSILACGTPPTFDNQPVPMRDGVHLSTDVYLPDGEGPHPVMVVRTVYGKDLIAPAISRYVDAGIAVVAQDNRGRFASEGVDMIFTTDGDGDLQDGFDTFEWIDEQGWSNGTVVTYGASALGIVQYVQTVATPPGLAGVMPTVATPTLYTHGVSHGGVFRDSLMTGWLDAQGSAHFLDDIAAHPYQDAFWHPVQTDDRFDVVDVPGLHIGGWYDIFTQGTLDGFMGYQYEGGPGAAGAQHLIMGPWTHGGLERTAQGELAYPATAAAPPVGIDEASDAFLDHVLGLDGALSGLAIDDVPPVQYYVMGDVDDALAPGNEWRVADHWPPEAAPIRMHLHADGALAESCPGDGTTSYVFDPASPSQTLCGGNLLIAAGPCDQRAVEERSDVVVFQTPVLDAPMEITGRVRAHLFVALDQPDADLMVRMTDVYPDGRSMLITDGAARVAARNTTTGLTPVISGEVVQIEVDLFSTSIVIADGHQLRMSVTSSNAPRYEVNRNNGLDWPAMTEGPMNVVTVSLHHDDVGASYLELPMPDRSPGDVTVCD